MTQRPDLYRSPITDAVQLLRQRKTGKIVGFLDDSGVEHVTAVNNYDNLADLPPASEFGVGTAHVTEIPAMLYISNGVSWFGSGAYSIGIPCIFPPSGSFANNGALTITSIVNVYPNCYMYFPANAIFAGSLEGMYYTEMVSATQGIVYNNVANSVPTIPTNPIPFVCTGPGAYTQVTASAKPLLSIQLAGNSLGPRGKILAKPMWEFPNNANQKNSYFGVNGLTSVGDTNASNASSSKEMSIQFAGYNSQVIPTSGGGITSAALIRSTEDTGIDFTVDLSGRLTVATDYLVLVGAVIMLTYGE